MSGLGASTYRASEGKLRVALSDAGDIWTEDATPGFRYGPESGFSQIALAPSLSRVSVGGNIAGFGTEPETLAGAINTGPVPVQHPLRSSLWELNHFLSLLGISAAPVQLDSSTAYRHTMSNKQTAGVDWVATATQRAMYLYFATTGEFNQRWGPAGVQSWQLNVANNSVASSTWNYISLQYGLQEGIADIDAGTPTTVPIMRGLFNEANLALAAAEQLLSIQVVSVGAEAGTAADPKTVVCKADLGSTPSYGSITFTVTCGSESGEGGNPRWARVVNSNTGSEIGAFDVGAPIEIAILDVAATGYAALDVVSWPLVNVWTPSLTTEPALLSVNTCVSLDGIDVTTPETFDISITNDRKLVPGGFCRAMSQSFNRSENLKIEVGFTRKWITDRIQEKTLLGSKVALVLTIDSGIEVDPGTSNETYKVTITVPNLRPPDGATLMAFANGAGSETETLAWGGHPDASLTGSAGVEVVMVAAVADQEA